MNQIKFKLSRICKEERGKTHTKRRSGQVRPGHQPITFISSSPGVGGHFLRLPLTWQQIYLPPGASAGVQTQETRGLLRNGSWGENGHVCTHTDTHKRGGEL